jgi:predicted dehydrogenase
MDKVKIGVMSFAHMHAHSYSECLRNISNAEFVGIYDDNAKRGKEMAKRLGVEFFKTEKKFFAEKMNGVIICSENSKHLAMIESAAKAKVHILCEKPISTNMRDGNKMLSAVQKAGVKLMIAFPCRFIPSIVKARRVLDSGEIGRILAIKATNHGSMPGGWFTDKKFSGGGAVMDHTVHVADLLRWFVRQEVRTVYAEIDKSIHNMKIDDCGTLLFEFENGVFASLDPSWSRPKSFPVWGDVTMDIIGEKGNIYVDAFSEVIDVYEDKIGKHVCRSWGSNANLGLVKNFVDMILYNRMPFISGYDGLKAMEVALGAYESAAKKKVVELPLK